MRKVVTIIIICILFITTGILAYTTYNLYQENQELQEEIDDLKDKKKSSSNKNDNSLNKENTSFKEENNNKDNVVVDNKNESTAAKSDEYSNIKEISYSDLENMLFEKQSFILLVAQTGCSHCEAYRPVFNKVLKENKITAYEIDTRKLTEQEYMSFNEFAYVSGTPTTIFVKDGEEISTSNRLIGNVSSDKIVSRLKALDYIK